MSAKTVCHYALLRFFEWHSIKREIPLTNRLLEMISNAPDGVSSVGTWRETAMQLELLKGRRVDASMRAVVVRVCGVVRPIFARRWEPG